MNADVLLADVVIDRDLSEIEARLLVDSIRVDITDVGERIATAYLGRAWIGLGYADWDALCDAEFVGARLRVPREVRVELVQSLSAAGLSTRSAAKALGVGQRTIVRDLASGESDDSPSERTPVVGKDGKRYAPTQPPRPSAPSSAASTSAGEGSSSPPSAPTTAARDSGSRPPVDGGEPGHLPITRHPDYRDEPAVNPLAAARADVAKQPAMLAGKAVDKLHSARLLLSEAGSAADIVADLVHDGLVDGDQGHDWLPELDALLPLLTDLAGALRRRNLRSVKP